MGLNEGILKALLPTVRKMVSDEKVAEIYDKITFGCPQLAGTKTALVATKKNGHVVLSVATVENMQIVQIHKQYTVEDLQNILNN